MGARKLTPSQRFVLELARDGKDLLEDCHGRSEHGGRACAIASCRRRGWLSSQDELTIDGRAVLKQ